MQMKTIAAALVSAAALAVASIPAPAAATPTTVATGRPVSVTEVANLDRVQVAAVLADVPFKNVHARQAVPGVPHRISNP